MNKHIHLHYLFLITVLALAFHANATSYKFYNYSITEGLSHHTINCLMQDRTGFIWVGTSDGLNRFDGYTFKKYYKNTEDSLSLHDNNITEMAQDSAGIIWLCSSNGFYRFSPYNESFRKIVFTPTKADKLAEDICVDHNGNVWGVENNNLLLHINASETGGRTYSTDSLLRIDRPLFNKKIVYKAGALWIFSSLGIIRFDVENKTARLIQTDIEFTSPRNLRNGKSDDILVFDWHKGIFSLDTKTLTIRPFMQEQMALATKDIVGITDVLCSSDHSVWIMKFPGLFNLSESDGVTEFNLQTGYERDYGQVVYFTSMQDRQGNIWFGTQNEGLIVASKNETAFQHFSALAPEHKNSPAQKILIDGDTTLFCNLNGTFISTSSENTNRRNYTKIDGAVSVALSKYDDNRYLIFEKNRVVAYDPLTSKMQPIYETFDLQNGMFDSRGIIWMTHWEQGLEGYNPRTGKRYQIDVDDQEKSLNVVFTLTEDADGSLWLGTFGSGLQHVKNPASDQPIITKYLHSGDKNSLSHNFITTLFDDGHGTLWIGTNGGGLHKFDKQTQTFTTFTTNDGLQGNVIQSIVADNDGNIWLATNGIAKLNVAKNTFTHFGRSDGILSRYFTLAAEKDRSGTLFFGDDQGIIAFNPKNIKGKNTPPTPIFTGVRLFGQPIATRQPLNGTVPFSQAITYSDSVTLPYNFNALSLEFASVTYPQSNNIRYEYMLEGIEQNWVKAGANERIATYAGLAHGEYTFHVRASNGQSHWSKTGSVHIVITPPWWKTLWFRIGFSLAGIMVFSMSIYWYIQSLKSRNKRLESMVQKRTEDLLHANETLKDEGLVIEMKNNQLNDMLSSKEKLISILTNEFKDPLASIFSFSQNLQNAFKQRKTDHVEKHIETITNSSESLVNQMEALLEWAHSEDQNIQARPIEINAEILVNDAIALVKTLAEQKNISIESQNSALSTVCIDPRMGSLIFRNILGNAIAHTPNNGVIIVIIKEIADTIEISFIDNGVGISNQSVDQLLTKDLDQPSESSTENEAEIAPELRLCKQFIDKNNGTLSIASAERQGSVFTVSFPKGKKPIPNPAENHNSENIASPADDSNIPRKPQVLIVDDDPTMCTAISGILEPAFSIITSNNGREGLTIALETLPDAVITDIEMPDLSGIDLCGYLKKNSKSMHIPVLVLSSYNDEETKNKAFNAGANDYIEKPFNSFHLQKKVESLLVMRRKITEQARSQIVQEVYPELPKDYDNEVVNKVNVFIENNMGNENLNTNLVAKELGISRAHLWRIYKKETGLTIGDFIKDRKLQKASALLLTGKYRISDVAYELGYSDPRYFSRWFTKEIGMNPTQYIEKMSRLNH